MKKIWLGVIAGIFCMAISAASGEASYEGKKVFYINSYHTGYEWSDGITKGIHNILDLTGVDLREFEMDTKRNPSEEFKQKIALEAKDMIEEFNPDVIITADDNAFKDIIMSFYRDAAVPVVFCGLNWDASIYGAPYTNTTGMVEVALIPQLISYMKEHAKGSRVGYLAADVLTARKEGEYYNKLFNLNIVERYVSTLDEWKEAFVAIQKEVDILIVGNNAGINDWNERQAALFAQEHTIVPTGAIYNWMMPYALVGVIKVEAEQGEWAATAALQILNGTKPSDIPIVENKEGRILLNMTIAKILGIRFSMDIIEQATFVE